MYRFDAELWMAEGPGSWHFVTVPGDVSDDIGARGPGRRPGFGSVRVRATVDGMRWETSVFPDSKRGAYVLPVKRAVRRHAEVEAGDRITVALEVRTD